MFSFRSPLVLFGRHGLALPPPRGGRTLELAFNLVSRMGPFGACATHFGVTVLGVKITCSIV